MGLIKEPIDVNFSVDGRELTAEEHQKISEYIQAQKAIRLKKISQSKKEQKKTRVFMDDFYRHRKPV